MVLRATSNGQVTMGDSNRARHLDTVNNADVNRDRPFASTPFETIHE